MARFILRLDNTWIVLRSRLTKSILEILVLDDKSYLVSQALPHAEEPLPSSLIQIAPHEIYHTHSRGG